MGRKDRWKSEEAAALAPELAAPVEEPVPAVPVSVVVQGAAAHDPLAHGPQVASKLPAATWAAARRMRPVESAAFLSWARLNVPGDKTPDEWAALFASFQQLPVK